MSEIEQNSTYSHAASFTGIFVTQKARITKDILPNYPMLYVPLPEYDCFAYCPNSFHDVFYHFEFQEFKGTARFISPLRYILSAN